MNKLPLDILNIIGYYIVYSKNIKGKLKLIKQLLNFCKTSKRLYLIWQRDDIWKQLYLRDLSLELPTTNIKSIYLILLQKLDTVRTIDIVIRACKSDCEQLIKNMVENGFDTDKYNRDLLLNMVKGDSIKTFKYLYDKGIKFDNNALLELACHEYPALKIVKFAAGKLISPFGILSNVVYRVSHTVSDFKHRFPIFIFVIDNFTLSTEEASVIFTLTVQRYEFEMMEYLSKRYQISVSVLNESILDIASIHLWHNKTVKILTLLKDLGGDLNQNGQVEVVVRDDKIMQCILKLSDNKCTGKTAKGKPCSRKPQPGKTTCFRH